MNFWKQSIEHKFTSCTSFTSLTHVGEYTHLLFLEVLRMLRKWRKKNNQIQFNLHLTNIVSILTLRWDTNSQYIYLRFCVWLQFDWNEKSGIVKCQKASSFLSLRKNSLFEREFPSASVNLGAGMSVWAVTAHMFIYNAGQLQCYKAIMLQCWARWG